MKCETRRQTEAVTINQENSVKREKGKINEKDKTQNTSGKEKVYEYVPWVAKC